MVRRGKTSPVRDAAPHGVGMCGGCKPVHGMGQSEESIAGERRCPSRCGEVRWLLACSRDGTRVGR